MTKGKHYQMIWRIPEGFQWVLFIGNQPQYHHGTTATKEEAEQKIEEIKETIQPDLDVL